MVEPPGSQDEQGDGRGEDGPVLPPGIAAAWGLKERPARGPKRGLTLDRIVRAGLTVAAGEGLAAVSMARVAGELGVGTMSLYRYVQSKSELLELMVDAGLGPPPTLDPALAWRDGLAAWAWAELGAYRRHLWVVQVPLTGPPITPNALGWMELALRSMRDTGLSESERMSVILLLASYVRSQATLEAQIDAAVRATRPAGVDFMAEQGKLLAQVIDPQRFPELTAVAASGVMSQADPWDDEFVFGLDRILDGVQVLIATRSGSD